MPRRSGLKAFSPRNDFFKKPQGLGLTTEAIENYREFLRYWENADIQVKSVRDAKERLARLTS